MNSQYLASIIVAIVIFLNVIYYFIQYKNQRKKIFDDVSAKLHKKFNEELNSENISIALINSHDDISNIATEIINQSISIYKFDYIIISTVNQLEQTISSRYFKSVNNFVKPNEWIRDSSYKIYEIDDIICRRVMYKDCKIINGYEIDINSDKEGLNKRIWNENKHWELNRIFLPIFLRLARDQEIDSPNNEIGLAVIEAGFHYTTKKVFPEEILERYKNFIDKCGYNYYRTYNSLQQKEINNILNKYSKVEDAKEYLLSILKESMNLFNADYGDISFVTFNDENERIKVISLPEGQAITREPIIDPTTKKTIGIVGYVLKESRAYFSNNVENDEYYSHCHEGIKSEISIPLFYLNTVVGSVNIESKYDNSFSVFSLNILNRIFNAAIPQFYIKKFSKSSRALVEPINIFNEIFNIYRAIVELISKNFYADYVSIWERDIDNNKLVDGISQVGFLPKHSSEKLRKDFNIEQFNKINYQLLDKSNEIKIITRTQEVNSNLQLQLSDFCQCQSINTMIIVPIMIEKKRAGFINIYSKRKITEIFYEWNIFLLQIANKAALAIQHAKLVKSFQSISSFLIDESKIKELKFLTNSAREILLADVVILFRLDEDNKIITPVTISGQLRDDQFIKEIQSTGLKNSYTINYVIDNEEIWINNYQEYQIIEQKREEIFHRKFNHSFWHRESIKSLAAIKLTYNNKPIGVMFFNYRSEQIFNDRIEQLIRAFGSFASVNIITAKYIELIRAQKRELEKKSESIQFEYEKIFDKMQAMVSLSTRTSFYMILETLNHDIRNTLLSLKKANLKIQRSYQRLSDRDKEVVDESIKNTTNGIAFIESLLTLFKFTDQNEIPINPTFIILNLIAFIKTRDECINISFDTKDLLSNDHFITFVKAEFSMIVYNLLTNAIYSIKKAEREKGLIIFTSKVEKNNYILTIEDNGKGVDKDDLLKIYEPGFSRKEEGLGIGLYFIKEVLENSYGGSINCYTKFKEFAKFEIKIPYRFN